MIEPILQGSAGKERTEPGDEKLPEVGMFAHSEQLPEVCIRQRLVRSYFELEQMVLIRVEVDGVYTARITAQEIIQHVISSAGDAQHNVIFFYFQQAVIHPWIFPSESVYVLVPELQMFLELVVIVNAPVMMLIEAAR